MSLALKAIMWISFGVINRFHTSPWLQGLRVDLPLRGIRFLALILSSCLLRARGIIGSCMQLCSCAVLAVMVGLDAAIPRMSDLTQGMDLRHLRHLRHLP